MRYCFFSGSCWAEEDPDAPPADEPEEGCAAESLLEEPEELGEEDEPPALGVELEPEALGEAEEPPLAEPDPPAAEPLLLGVLPPPEAEDEPDLAGSLAPALPLADELDEPGVEDAAPDEGLPALPPTDDEPELEPGELGGMVAELLLPLLPLVLPDF